MKNPKKTKKIPLIDKEWIDLSTNQRLLFLTFLAAIIVPIVGISGWIIDRFIPKNGNQSLINTPTIFVTLTTPPFPPEQTSPTLSPTFSIIATDATASEKEIPSETITPDFLEHLIFKDECIPNDWFPFQFEIYADKSSSCLGMSYYQITAIDNGLDIWTENKELSNKLAGLYFYIIPKIESISFYVSFEKVVPAYNGMNTDFFFGFLSDEANLTGKFYVIRNTTYNNDTSFVAGSHETLARNVNLSNSEYFSTLPKDGKFKITIKFEKQGYKIYIADDIQEKIYDQYPVIDSGEKLKFVIGYKLDTGGNLKMKVTDFKINLEKIDN